MKKCLILATIFFFLFFAGVVFAQKSAAPNKDQRTDEKMNQLVKQLTDEIQSTYQSASELTLKGDKVLFLPDNKVGDAAGAQSLYTRSNELLSKFFARWADTYRQQPSLFALLDVLRVQNMRGLAWVALAYGDKGQSVKYRQETINIAQVALNYIKSSTIKNPQFAWATETLQRYLSEAHFFLYIDYKSKNDSAKAKEHLKQAAATTPDQKLKAAYEDMLKKEK
jgi:hypothetical protein